MQGNTSVAALYHLLGAGVHLDESRRFADAATPAVDPNAETIPAPPPRDLTTISTAPCSLPPPSLPVSELLDFGPKPPEFWDEVADLVERMPA